MIFVNADVHLRHPTFVEARKQIFQQKSTLVVNLGPSNPPLEMVFDQGKMPFVNFEANRANDPPTSLQHAKELASPR